MGNVKLIFQGTTKSKTNEHELEVFANKRDEISLFLSSDEYLSVICLDKTTAVRLVRELKKQIGYLGSEVTNG